jgi:DNA-binding transcriptional LysR family regulator
MALAIVSETDMIAALPRQLVAMHAARFGVVSTQAPLPLPLFRIRAIAPKVAMMDAGLAWLFDAMRDAIQVKRPAGRKRRPT